MILPPTVTVEFVAATILLSSPLVSPLLSPKPLPHGPSVSFSSPSQFRGHTGHDACRRLARGRRTDGGPPDDAPRFAARRRRGISSAPSFSPSPSPTTTALGMLARRSSGGAGGGGGTKKKKKKGNNNTRRKPNLSSGGANAKNRRRSGVGGGRSGGGGGDRQSEVNRASEKKNVALPAVSNKSHSPPWQVMSEKDRKRNAAALKARREMLASGGEDDAGILDRSAKFVADVGPSNRLLSEADRSLFRWKRFNPIDGVGGVAFVGSYLDRRMPPSLGVPEVAFLGRSNVGKSSLLNRLLDYSSKGRDGAASSDRARVGKTPGATASVNLYALLRKSGRAGERDANAPIRGGGSSSSRSILGFADLPGFGYAKLSKETKGRVEVAAERYLDRRRELALGVLLVDARRVPSDDDRAVLEALYDMKVPICVVATKVDKVTGRGGENLDSALGAVRDVLDLPDGQPLAVSSVTGEGTRDLWRIIMDACEVRVAELRDGAAASSLDAAEGEVSSRSLGQDRKRSSSGGEATFADDEDLVYDQGYDWIDQDGRGVMFEDDDGRENVDDDLTSAADFEEGMIENEEWAAAQQDALKLKALKKEARNMERRGEV